MTASQARWPSHLISMYCKGREHQASRMACSLRNAQEQVLPCKHGFKGPIRQPATAQLLMADQLAHSFSSTWLWFSPTWCMLYDTPAADLSEDHPLPSQEVFTERGPRELRQGSLQDNRLTERVLRTKLLSPQSHAARRHQRDLPDHKTEIAKCFCCGFQKPAVWQSVEHAQPDML